MDTTQAERVAALEHERAGYVARGLTDRVKAVDAELARLGAKPPADTKADPPAENSDAEPAPETRPAPRRSTRARKN